MSDIDEYYIAVLRLVKEAGSVSNIFFDEIAHVQLLFCVSSYSWPIVSYVLSILHAALDFKRILIQSAYCFFFLYVTHFISRNNKRNTVSCPMIESLFALQSHGINFNANRSMH